MINILVCDDDPDIVNAIEIYLRPEGYNVLKAYNGLQALEIIRSTRVHLLILDIMMPKMDGIRTTLRIREENNIPIIILSAKSEDSDKVIGLNIGADDYVTKPFHAPELVARVKSQLRRYTRLGSLEQAPEGCVYQTGGLVVDDRTRTVTVDGALVEGFTPTQYKLLLFLIQNKGKTFSTEELFQRVWGLDAYRSENTVAVHIRHIRKKIEVNSKEPRYLVSVWGIGYKIANIEPQLELGESNL